MLFAMSAASSALTSLLSAATPHQQQASKVNAPGASDPRLPPPLSFEALALDSAHNHLSTTPTPSNNFSPETMSTLIAAQAQQSTDTTLSPRQAALFAKLDADASGSISKSEFETALGADNKALADKIFGKIDSNNDGVIS